MRELTLGELLRTNLLMVALGTILALFGLGFSVLTSFISGEFKFGWLVIVLFLDFIFVYLPISLVKSEKAYCKDCCKVVRKNDHRC